MNTNNDIRRAAAASGIRLWQIAEAIGVTDGTFSRRLRRELPAEEKARVLAIIDELSKEATCGK